MGAPRVDLRLLEAYLREGRGFGHGEQYKALIQLRRWNASPVSVQTCGHIPPFRRRMHFLCRSEWLIALLLAWVGCHVREQVPLWPWRHPHLLYGLSATVDASLCWSSGTIELCRQAGIKHGTFVGTKIPYIWTADLVANFAWLPIDQIGGALVSVKPLESEEYTGDIDPLARGPEKLEIERRFSSELAMPYFVADRSLYPGDLLGQLELYSSAASLPAGHPAATCLPRFIDRHGDELGGLPPRDWRDRLCTDFGLSDADADIAISHILWTQLVDVDLSREIQMEDPPRPGGRALQAAVRSALVAEHK